MNWTSKTWRGNRTNLDGNKNEIIMIDFKVDEKVDDKPHEESVPQCDFILKLKISLVIMCLNIER